MHRDIAWKREDSCEDMKIFLLNTSIFQLRNENLTTKILLEI
jgi:hypothetical protein